MQAIYEQYRPRTWGEVIGQEKAIKEVLNVAKRGLENRAFWISGTSGTGKTTIAKLIAQEVADPLDTVEVNGRDLKVADLKDLEWGWHYATMSGKGHCLIVNESHGLGKPVIEYLLNLLENLAAGKSGHAVVIFTTTLEGQAMFDDKNIDSGPLGSRCIDISLSTQGLCKAFARRAKEILTAEGLDGADIVHYERFLKDNGNNFRKLLEAGEKGKFSAE